MEQVLGYLTNPLVIALISLTIAKLLPNDRLSSWGEKLGVVCTLGLSRILPGVWVRIESWLINGVSVFIKGFIKGLESDNK